MEKAMRRRANHAATLILASFAVALNSFSGEQATIEHQVARLISPPQVINLTFAKTSTAPKIDGKDGDQSWKEIREIRVLIANGTGSEIFGKLKVCEFRGTAYILLRFPQSAMAKESWCWHWNPVQHAYFLSGNKGPVMSLIFKDPGNTIANFADVWIWRSERNDPANFADDMSLTGKWRAKRPPLVMDAGHPAWFSKYFAEFAGAALPRFYSRAPSGSAGDVRGRSSWKNGMVTLELARKLKTGHKDDIELGSGCTLRIAIIQ